MKLMYFACEDIDFEWLGANATVWILCPPKINVWKYKPQYVGIKWQGL